MSITFFSFFMAVLFSSAFILIVHLLRNNRIFLNGFGMPTILVLYALCICRMVFPIEFSFTIPIRMEKTYNSFYEAVCKTGWMVGEREVSLLEAAGCLWAVGSVLCLVFFLVHYLVSGFRLRRFEGYRDVKAEKILEAVKKKASRQYPIHLFIYPRTPIPMGVGLFRRVILLPPGERTNSQTYYILEHEYAHFLNHDHFIKLLVHLFRCVFWWNPLVYLLQIDVAQILEG